MRGLTIGTSASLPQAGRNNLRRHHGFSGQQAIEKANRGFVDAVERGDVTAAVLVYTDDATILPPGHRTVTGRPGIKDFWAGAAQQLGITAAELKTVSLDVLTSETAYEVGEYRARFGGNDRCWQIRRSVEGRQGRMAVAPRYLEQQRGAKLIIHVQVRGVWAD